MFDLLEHVSDDRAVVAETFRVLKPGGVVIVSTPSDHWAFPYYRGLQPICPTDQDMMAEWGHVRRGYSDGDLERLFASRPARRASFINGLTAIGHDISFARLPRRVRLLLWWAVSPLTWLGYALHRPAGKGTEIAAAWLKS
jgi:SAM-dependent methyltransferase